MIRGGVSYRYVILVAVCALLLIASGAWVTGNQQSGAATDTQLHVVAAAVTGALALGLAGWLSVADRGWLRWLGWGAVAVFAIDGALGWRADLPALSPAIAVVHASLAPLFFSILVVIAVFLSPYWKSGPEPTDDRGWPALRYLAIALPPLVLLQIVLGAAYRHKITGVMPHMGGAMLVAIDGLVVSMVVIQQYPAHRALRPAAVALVSVLLAQITLGIAAFTMQLLDLESAAAFVPSTVLHVVVGCVTLGASLAMAIQVQRNVQPATTS